MKLGPEDAGRIYEQCREHLDSLMKMEQKDYPDAQNKAAAYFTKVEQPYEYYPGYNKDATDYLVLYLLLLEFICVFLGCSRSFPLTTRQRRMIFSAVPGMEESGWRLSGQQLC